MERTTNKEKRGGHLEAVSINAMLADLGAQVTTTPPWHPNMSSLVEHGDSEAHSVREQSVLHKSYSRGLYQTRFK